VIRIHRLILGLLSGFCICICHQVVAQNKTNTLPLKDPSAAQGMEGGLWRIDHNFESTLELKNVLINHPITATPVLYLADGAEYELQPVTLEPAGVASVNIGAALRDLPPNLQAHWSSYGMLGVRYHWSWLAAIIGVVRNIDESAMVSFQSSLHADINEAHSQSPRKDAERIEGPWWIPFATTGGFVVLSNALLTPTQISIVVNDSSGKAIGHKTSILGSHASQWLQLSDLAGGPLKAGSTGSLVISYDGPTNSISAFGGLEDDTNGYSATLHLQEMHPEQARDLTEHTVVLDGPSLMIGTQRPEMQFPEGTSFGLYTVVHNTSNQARQAALSGTFAGSTGPETRAFGAINLAPAETAAVDYKAIFGALKLGPLDGSVDLSIAYTGHDGDVQVEEGSVDGSGNYVFQVEPQTEDWTASRTVCHWSILRDSDTMISLWNYLGKSEDLTLTLYYAGGNYVIPIHLEPRANFEVDMASLIHTGHADPKGSVIPQSITEGSAILADALDERNRIYVASNTGIFNVRTATCINQCQTCNGVSSLSITPNPATVVVKNTIQAQAKETWNTGSIYYTTGGEWSSSAPNVSVNANGVVTGVSAGSSQIQLTETGLPAPAGYICTGPNGGCPPTINASATDPDTATCPSPTAETNQAVFNAATITQFDATVSDSSADSFDGRTVYETSPIPSGTNTCYWSGNPDNMVPNPIVNGGKGWPIGGDTAFHNKYGPDNIGFYPGTVGDIRTLGTKAGVVLPCTATLTQIMSIDSCGGKYPNSYIRNTDTSTVNKSSVTDCRASTCNPINQ